MIATFLATDLPCWLGICWGCCTLMMDHSVTADDDNIRNLRLEQLVTRVFTDLSLMRAAERVLCAQKHAARSQTLMTHTGIISHQHLPSNHVSGIWTIKQIQDNESGFMFECLSAAILQGGTACSAYSESAVDIWTNSLVSRTQLVRQRSNHSVIRWDHLRYIWHERHDFETTTSSAKETTNF